MTESVAKSMDILLINNYNTTDTNYGYNMMKGGDYGLAPSMYTEERRKKMSIARTGKCMGEKHSSSKKVICLNTKEVFGSSGVAAKQYHTRASQIGRCCREHKYYAGFINTQPLTWLFYDEYLKMSQEEIQKLLTQGHKMRLKQEIICLNTLEVFPTKIYVIQNFNIGLRDSSGLSVACGDPDNGVRHHAGKINNESLYWMNLREYKSLNTLQQQLLKTQYYTESFLLRDY